MSADMQDILSLLLFGILWIEVCDLRTLPERYK